MSFISKEFANELSRKRGFRHRYLGAQTGAKIVRQIRAMRRQRGWSQANFAVRLNKPASNVSQRLENLDYSGFSLKTLLEVAEACDVGLVVEFVPYKDFIRRTDDLSTDKLEVNEFSEGDLDELTEASEENVKSDQAVAVAPVVVALPLSSESNRASEHLLAHNVFQTPIVSGGLNTQLFPVPEWNVPVWPSGRGVAGTAFSGVISPGLLDTLEDYSQAFREHAVGYDLAKAYPHGQAGGLPIVPSYQAKATIR